MRKSLQEMMDALGVGYVLGPYETFPWSVYDEERGQTCSAEVRMDHEGLELECEVQLLHDTPPEDKGPLEQIMWMQALPHQQNQKWSVQQLRIKGEDFANDTYNWEEKGCNLFRAIVQAIQLDEIPDFDRLIDEEMRSKERFGDQVGSGGGKSPKIKPAQLMDMKKGQGF